MFASDEEALAAAEELYGRYNKLSNELGAGGWSDTSELSEVLSGAALAGELETSDSLSTKGYRQIGDSSFDSVTLQQLIDHGAEAVALTIYVCLDVSEVDVIDGDGSTVVSASRPDRQALEVEMNDNDGALKIVRSEAWSGANFC